MDVKKESSIIYVGHSLLIQFDFSVGKVLQI